MWSSRVETQGLFFFFAVTRIYSTYQAYCGRVATALQPQHGRDGPCIPIIHLPPIPFLTLSLALLTLSKSQLNLVPLFSHWEIGTNIRRIKETKIKNNLLILCVE